MRARSITAVIWVAYCEGLLQYDTMTIKGITISMTMFSSYNRLSAMINDSEQTINVYDNDSEDSQYASILNLISGILRI